MNCTIERSSEEAISLELIPCPTCNRTFVQQTLEKHVGICEKMAVKKRKIFDSSRQRREGTELASYPLPKNYRLKNERGVSPKPIQQASPMVHSPKRTPEDCSTHFKRNKVSEPNSSKKTLSSTKATSNSFGTSSPNVTVLAKERNKTAKRIQPPPAEPCPYCQRCFGVKAYDRHVEWCKEKSLIASIKQSNINSKAAAKERLEARIKYKAPCLKTKRSLNRDKYSYQSDENFDMLTSMDESQKRDLMTSSMNSSFISDSIISDNYDPFISAKRQLEELCSPSSPNHGNISPSQSVVSCKTPILKSPNLMSKMTTSFTSRGTLTNPRAVLTTPKSNFNRTSSLRGPRRSPLPISSRSIFFPSSQKQRPTIQRGLSDEGPISSNFIKPEEYDEMPVRAVCVNDFAISNTPRVNRRDSNATPNRKVLALNLSNINKKNKNTSSTLLQGNLLKTDSLAIFLKHEIESKESDSSIASAKELKDKSNALSKQNSAKSVVSTVEQTSVNPKYELSKTTDSSTKNNAKLNSLRLESNQNPMGDFACNSEKITWSSDIKMREFDKCIDTDYIDPMLINVCDNLSMELGNDLASNSSFSSPHSSRDRSECDAKKLDQNEENRPNHLPVEKEFLNEKFPDSSEFSQSFPNSNRSSSGDNNRTQLKRKIRLGRNQFLYDASPEAFDNHSDEETSSREHEKPQSFDQTIRNPTSKHSVPNTIDSIPQFSPSTFNEFDFETFLSAFDNDDENFPSLFKDCREFLMNRSTVNKRSNIDSTSPYRSAKDLVGKISQKYEQEVELNLDSDENKNRGEIFISIETDQNENDPHLKYDPLVTANPSAQVEEVKFDDNKFQKIEDNEKRHQSIVTEDNSKYDSQFRRRSINLLKDFPNTRLHNANTFVQHKDEDFQETHKNEKANVKGCSEKLVANQIAEKSNEFVHGNEAYRLTSLGGASEFGQIIDGHEIRSKQSSDSAYGSLCRQSPDDERSFRSKTTRSFKPTLVSHNLTKKEFLYPASTPTGQTFSSLNKHEFQQQRQRKSSLGSSNSSSDNSLPTISTKKHLTSAEHGQKRTFNSNRLSTSSLEMKINSSKSAGSISNSSSTKSSNSQITTTLSNSKVSKFCHECGSKFLLDQAKFCMDCGVRRIVLK